MSEASFAVMAMAARFQIFVYALSPSRAVPNDRPGLAQELDACTGVAASRGDRAASLPSRTPG
jgi:hypothetical protein